MQTSPLRNFQKEKNKTVQNQSSFTEGKILSPLLRFAVPVLLAMFLQAMYGAVDLLIVGKFASTSDISAVATGSQLMATVTFAVQALSLEWLVKHKDELETKVYDIPAEIDDQIGRVKLAAMGLAIDELTEEQKAYLAGWEA